MIGEETAPAGQTPVDSHAEGERPGEVRPKTPSPTDIQQRETAEDHLLKVERAISSIGDSWCEGGPRLDCLTVLFDLARSLATELSDREAEDEPLAEYKAMNARLAADLRTALRSNPQPGSEGEATDAELFNAVVNWLLERELIDRQDARDGLTVADVITALNEHENGMEQTLAASPTPPTAQAPNVEGWAISQDGPNAISDHRKWLARQLLDSKLADDEAFGIVAYAPSISDVWRSKPTAQPGEVERLQKALEPFARFGAGIPSDQNDATDKSATFSVGDFRRAYRAALTPSESQEA